MDNENKYNNALEKLQEALAPKNGCEISGLTRGCIESIFPELAESKDDRIRKEIIEYIKTGTYHKDWIAWLEKKESVEEIVERCKKSWYNEGKIQGQIEGLTDEEKYQQGWHDALEKQGEPSDKGEISDGFHTFNELYYYRMLYNAAFFNMLPKEWVHKSKKHNDGEECFGGGWFIVMANLPTGQISNHYELKDWYLFQIPEKERADKWDGHTPQEAAERLHNFLLKKKGDLKPQGKSALEAWKEKKVDNRNKVEQKFKVGDWIVEPRKGEHNCIWHIERIEKNSYWEGHVGVFIEHADKYYHLWTIADAKDGDVLASNVLISKYNKPFIYNGNHNSTHVGAYCGISTENRFNVATEKCRWTANVNIRPATKEQRDVLFAKMREAGYEWDADKKEPKKIEPKFKVKYAGSEYNVLEIKESAGVKFYGIEDEPNHIDYVLSDDCEIISGYGEKEKGSPYPTKSAIFSEQKPNWSEEDEKRIKKVMHIISCDGRISNEECKNIFDWLESIKERVQPHWKPSEKQLDALQYVYRNCNPPLSDKLGWDSIRTLELMYQDLKKLKKE